MVRTGVFEDCESRSRSRSSFKAVEPPFGVGGGGGDDDDGQEIQVQTGKKGHFIYPFMKDHGHRRSHCRKHSVV